ncbi:hypothetical protein [Aureisphaera sp.]
MKNIFKIIALSFVLFLGMNTVNAQTLKQDQNRPEVIAKQQTADLSEALGLNGDQQRTIFRALVHHKAGIKRVEGKSSSIVAAEKKKLDASLQATMKKTLTKEQYDKWLTLKQ